MSPNFCRAVETRPASGHPIFRTTRVTLIPTPAPLTRGAGGFSGKSAKMIPTQWIAVREGETSAYDQVAVEIGGRSGRGPWTNWRIFIR